MTTHNRRKTIPENVENLLESTTLAHIATTEPDDGRVVVFVRTEHTTQKDG